MKSMLTLLVYNLALLKLLVVSFADKNIREAKSTVQGYRMLQKSRPLKNRSFQKSLEWNEIKWDEVDPKIREAKRITGLASLMQPQKPQKPTSSENGIVYYYLKSLNLGLHKYMCKLAKPYSHKQVSSFSTDYGQEDLFWRHWQDIHENNIMAKDLHKGVFYSIICG